MELYNGLLTRRSIRKYTGEPVNNDLIKQILKAGMFAPSANNTQPWAFLVSRNKDIFEGFKNIHPHSRMLLEAECGILILRDKNKQYAEGYGTTDCSAATQNILLAAHSLGLGACWIGTFPRDERIEFLSKAFDLPEHLEPFAMVSIGWPEKEPRQADRYDDELILWR